MQQGFKVVHVAADGRLISFGHPFGLVCDHAVVEYVPGVSALPVKDHGPLGVLISETAAIKFMALESVGPFCHFYPDGQRVEFLAAPVDYRETHLHFRLFRCQYTPSPARCYWQRRNAEGAPIPAICPDIVGSDYADTIILGDEVDLTRFIPPGAETARAPYFRKVNV